MKNRMMYGGSELRTCFGKCVWLGKYIVKEKDKLQKMCSSKFIYYKCNDVGW